MPANPLHRERATGCPHQQSPRPPVGYVSGDSKQHVQGNPATCLQGGGSPLHPATSYSVCRLRPRRPSLGEEAGPRGGPCGSLPHRRGPGVAGQALSPQVPWPGCGLHVLEPRLSTGYRDNQPLSILKRVEEPRNLAGDSRQACLPGIRDGV